MIWLKVIAMLPIAVLVLVAANFWEWWHFGPSGRILDATKCARKRLFKWRADIEKN